MNRLQAELQRLYLTPAPGAMLELARPADWEAIGAVWRGVQADLGLPAPAIAINGRDGYQLWFAFAEPLSAAQSRAFLEALRRRYLGAIAAARIVLTPIVDASLAPPQQLAEERWSAFVAPDLAPVFAEEPWLDMLPGIDGQAELLLRLVPIKAAALAAALEQLGGAGEPAPSPADPKPAAGASAAQADPRAFLLRVMNDEAAPLALRIEAAKALLPGRPD